MDLPKSNVGASAVIWLSIVTLYPHLSFPFPPNHTLTHLTWILCERPQSVVVVFSTLFSSITAGLYVQAPLIENSTSTHIPG